MSKDLHAAVGQLLSTAQAAFTPSDDPAAIKQSTETLSALLREWQTLDKSVESTVIGLLRLVRSRCPHTGAKRGYNERDGNWMTPCPTCGHSE